MVLAVLVCMLVLMCSAVSTVQGQVETPFEAAFPGEVPGDPWQVVKDEGASVTVKDGWVTTDGPVGARAHVEMPLGTDLVTVTARIGAVGAVYLSWDAGEWVSVGKVAPTPFGRFTTNVVTQGVRTGKLHTGCFHHLAHYVRIQSGNSAIRFFYSPDGSEWRLLRVMERPAAWQGAPKLLAFGKAYTPASDPFTSAGAVKGAAGPQAGSFTEVRVDETPEEALELSDSERKDLGEPFVDPVTRQFRATTADPTFDSIAPLYPAFRFPREVTGVPEHPLAIGVDYLARIDLSPWEAPVGWFLVGDGDEPLVRPGQKLERRLLGGWIPVVTLTTERDDVRWQLTVFGWSEDFSAEKDLWGYMELTAAPKVTGKRPPSVTLGFRDGSRRLDQGDEAGETAFVTRFRFRHPDPGTLEFVSRQDYDAKLAAVRHMWQERIRPAARFSVPDSRVENAWRAWHAYAMLNSDLVKGFVELHDGSGFYDSVFGYSMSLYAMMVDQYGLPERAARMLETQLHYQAPDGLYHQDAGLPDHGALILAVAHHYELTGDDEWLRRVAPELIKACDWVVRQRQSAPADGVARGLIKFRPYCDYREDVFSYFGNTYCCIGLEQAAKALASIGAPEASAYASEARRYRGDILASMDAAVVEHDGVRLLPIEPDTQRLLKDSNYRGGDYYGLVASCVLETDFLPPRDFRTQLLTDALEQRGGLIAGLCEFMEGIDHAYTFGYLLNQIRRDNVGEVLLGFWSMLAFGMVRDTFSPVEVHMIATGENHLTLPHSYSCTMQLKLLRSMLVLEDGEDLWITRAVPREWLEAGKRITAENAPTAFGPVSYRVERLGDGTVRVRINNSFHRRPERILVRLREPGGRAIASVSPAGRGVSYREDVLEIRNPAERVDLRVRFEE